MTVRESVDGEHRLADIAAHGLRAAIRARPAQASDRPSTAGLAELGTVAHYDSTDGPS